jgi:hypothetical protein
MRGDLAIVVVLAAALATGCSKKSAEGTKPVAGAPHSKGAKVRVVSPGDAPADLAQSRVQVSVIKDKDNKSPVVGRMKLADGAVAFSSASPSARLSIDIDSFDSDVPIRNERVRNIFFETSGVGWDTIEVTVPAIPPAVMKALHDARHVDQVKLDATLQVHGRKVPAALTVDASYSEDGRLTVKTSVPAQVKISDLALGDNLRRLSAICMHDSIDDVVLVDAVVQFAPPK